MRNILVILFLFLSIGARATNYFLTENGGGDTLSVTEFNAGSFSGNDTITIVGTVTGGIIIPSSGTSGSPIIINGYDSNAKISGFTTVTAWTNQGGNIWESTNAISTLSTCNMVIINGVNTPMGRYPNSGWLNIDSHSSTTSITCSTLTGTPDFTGADAIVKMVRWRLETTPIVSQSTSTITLTALSAESKDNYGFFIQDHLSTLDQQNEWYYNPTTKKLSIYSTTEPTNVQVPTIDNLITASGRSYITIDGINFTGANEVAYYNSSSSSHNTISNCNISYCGQFGTYGYSNDNTTIDANTFSDIGSIAVYFNYYCDTTAITNNSINRTGIIEGAGLILGNIFLGYSGVKITPYSHVLTCTNNIINNSGYDGISAMSNHATIQYNYVDSFCTVLDDGAGIYGGVDGLDRLIDHNIITNGIGNNSGTTSTSRSVRGIYIDDFGSNYLISNNTIANITGSGIYLHLSDSVTVRSNVVYNAEGQDYANACIGLHSEVDRSTLTTNSNIKSNILVTFETDTYPISIIYDGYDLSNIATFGDADSNYYVAPFNSTGDIAKTIANPSWTETLYTLSEWQSFLGDDVNSHLAPQSISTVDSLQFVYNPTATDSTITFSEPVIGMDGTKYATSTTLPAYSSGVFIVDANPTTDINYVPVYNSIYGKYILNKNGKLILVPVN